MDNQIKIEGISVGIEIREIGVYLIVERPPGNDSSLDFGSIRSFVDNCGVEDWDFGSVLEVIEDDSPFVEKLISHNTFLKSAPESAEVKVTPDKMFAEIIFISPINSEKLMNINDIRNVLIESRVVMGINEDMLLSIASDRSYNIPYIVAKGKEVENGENGKIECLFNTGNVSYKPKELETGKLDYFNLDLFQVSHKGQTLAVITPPGNGVDGFNVHGDIKRAAPGKAIVNPVGKNCEYSDDNLSVVASIDGQIVYTDNKINVNPILEIKGNVHTTTGNIHFLGTVIVLGNVLTGFSINATGNVEVKGVVEGATIICDGNLAIHGGVQGVEKAFLKSNGTITAKFIENATVEAKDDVIADSVLRCNIKCGGSLTLTGRRGQIIGGSAKVLHTISASIIGSLMEASTEIQAGIDPDLFEEYGECKIELAKLKKELTQIGQIVDTLAKAREEGRLTEPKKAILIKSLQSRSYIKTKISDLCLTIEKMIPELNKGTGVVRIHKLVNPGVKITIGNAVLYVKKRLDACSLSNVDGEIKVGDL